MESGPGSGAATPTTLNPAQRKKKPKRRSTGVVNIDFDVSAVNSEHFLIELIPIICRIHGQRNLQTR